MELDEAREQYEQLLRNSSSKALQKKCVFLERTLETLTTAHQQLAAQNNTLKIRTSSSW